MVEIASVVSMSAAQPVFFFTPLCSARPCSYPYLYDVMLFAPLMLALLVSGRP
ncbi:MAG: hypothetical protein M3P06_14370 [Acidobacteriota bacterium]|nr:hypothetical protein [Acidobacteriota bacterium]